MNINAAQVGAVVPFTYRFPAVIDDWHDGDTCTVHRGAWPGLTIGGERVRVQGINAPELNTAAGRDSLDFVRKVCPYGMLVELVANKQDKYGRFLARVILPDGRDLAQVMIEANMAVPYVL